MSGLDPEKSVILELAMLVTDNQLNALKPPLHRIINQPAHILDNMDDWNKKHHGDSGLCEAVLKSPHVAEAVESECLQYLSDICKSGESPLCGNSIYQDRRFLVKYMPKLNSFFHYRNIDVSSLKELIARWYPETFSPPKKKGLHKATDDILESIEELKYYRKFFFIPLKNLPFQA